MSATPAGHPRRRLGLLVIATAQFMVIMDMPIIGVALPKMQTDLGFSPEGLSWVFNAYVVAFVPPDGTVWVDVLPASLVAALGMSIRPCSSSEGAALGRSVRRREIDVEGTSPARW